MAYPISESMRKPDDDPFVEHADPRLFAMEARAELVRRILAVNEKILARRGGVPIDGREVEEALAELREERGAYRS